MDDVLNHDFPACLFQIAMVSHRADHLDHGPFHLEEQRVSSELHSGSPSSKAGGQYPPWLEQAGTSNRP